MKNISSINTNTAEGRLLMAALAKLTTESQTRKTPDEVLEQCAELSKEMYKDAKPTFQKAIESVINEYSMERAGANTPDFLLAEYMNMCLTAYSKTVNARDEWNKSELKKEPIILTTKSKQLFTHFKF